jgi:hypothetical protein
MKPSDFVRRSGTRSEEGSSGSTISTSAAYVPSSGRTSLLPCGARTWRSPSASQPQRTVRDVAREGGPIRFTVSSRTTEPGSTDSFSAHPMPRSAIPTKAAPVRMSVRVQGASRRRPRRPSRPRTVQNRLATGCRGGSRSGLQNAWHASRSVRGLFCRPAGAAKPGGKRGGVEFCDGTYGYVTSREANYWSRASPPGAKSIVPVA